MAWCVDHGDSPYYETSATEGYNVDRAFEFILKKAWTSKQGRMVAVAAEEAAPASLNNSIFKENDSIFRRAEQKAAKQNVSVPGGVAVRVPCSPPISIGKPLECASGADGEDRRSPSKENGMAPSEAATTASLAHARSPDELMHAWTKERLEWQHTQDELKAERDVLKGALAEQEQCYHQLCRDLQNSREECNAKEKGWMRANAELAELQAIDQQVKIEKVEQPEASGCTIKIEQLAGLGIRELTELQDALFERQDDLRESQRRVHQQIGRLRMPVCPICEDAPLSIVLVPCGHRLCSDCAAGFDVNHNQKNLSICPFCRQGFTQKVVCHDI